MIGERYAVGATAETLEEVRERRIGIAFPSTRLGDSPPIRLALAMTCIAVAGILYLAQASQVSVLEYNTSYLQAQQVQLDAQNAALRSTATQLQSLQRIDTLATQQLHMTKPDLSTAIWINPIFPRATPVRPLNADLVAAMRASQPLSWMQRFIVLVKSSF